MASRFLSERTKPATIFLHMEYMCKQCNVKFQRYPSQVRNPERTFCSSYCKGVWQKLNWVGDLNPNFRSGAYSDPKCPCGAVKDPRSEKCAGCSNRSYKVGEKGVYLDSRQIESVVKNSNSYLHAARALGVTRTTLKKYLDPLELDLSHFRPGRGRTLSVDKVLIKGSVQRHGTVKKLIARLKLLPYMCCHCGVIEWQGKLLTLEIDHINGDSRDNRIENLRYLCPNCHSQTSTYCGRNRKTST